MNFKKRSIDSLTDQELNRLEARYFAQKESIQKIADTFNIGLSKLKTFTKAKGWKRKGKPKC